MGRFYFGELSERGGKGRASLRSHVSSTHFSLAASSWTTISTRWWANWRSNIPTRSLWWRDYQGEQLLRLSCFTCPVCECVQLSSPVPNPGLAFVFVYMILFVVYTMSLCKFFIFLWNISAITKGIKNSTTNSRISATEIKKATVIYIIEAAGVPYPLTFSSCPPPAPQR